MNFAGSYFSFDVCIHKNPRGVLVSEEAKKTKFRLSDSSCRGVATAVNHTRVLLQNDDAR